MNRQLPVVVVSALTGAVLALASTAHSGPASHHGIGAADVVWWLLAVAIGGGLGIGLVALAQWSRTIPGRYDRGWQLIPRIAAWTTLALVALAVPLWDHLAGVAAIGLVVCAAAGLRKPRTSNPTTTTPAPVGYVAWPDCTKCGGRGTDHGRRCECVTPVYPSTPISRERSSR